MKLKTAEETETQMTSASSGGAVIADRFKLDVPAVQEGPAGVNKTAALIACLGAFAALAMLGTVAALTYMNWGEIAEL